MTSDVKSHCADMILACAVQDLSEHTKKPTRAILEGIIESPAYTALYDLETGLWASGPDYFTAFYQECLAREGVAGSVASE